MNSKVIASNGQEWVRQAEVPAVRELASAPNSNARLS